MKKILFAIAMMCAISPAANAQDDILDNGIFNHVSVGVGVGLDGISIEAASPITNYVQVRAGVSFFPHFGVSGLNVDIPSSTRNDWNNLLTTGQGTSLQDLRPYMNQEQQQAADAVLASGQLPNKISADGTFKKTDFKLLFDVFPLPNLSFHVTAGFYWGNSRIIEVHTTNCEAALNAMTVYSKELGGQTFNGTTLPKLGVEFQGQTFEPNGPVANAYLKTASFKPYLGIGFGRAVPKKTRLAGSCDIGVQFWGTPELYILDQKFSTDNIDEDFTKALKNVSVYPVISFKLCGRIL